MTTYECRGFQHSINLINNLVLSRSKSCQPTIHLLPISGSTTWACPVRIQDYDNAPSSQYRNSLTDLRLQWQEALGNQGEHIEGTSNTANRIHKCTYTRLHTSPPGFSWQASSLYQMVNETKMRWSYSEVLDIQEFSRATFTGNIPIYSSASCPVTLMRTDFLPGLSRSTPTYRIIESSHSQIYGFSRLLKQICLPNTSPGPIHNADTTKFGQI